MLIVNVYCSTVRALAMPYNVMLIKPKRASKPCRNVTIPARIDIDIVYIFDNCNRD
jgi:hypothetical protein